MIDDSEGLGTPHEAFCRILEVIRPENPGLGKTVTEPAMLAYVWRRTRDAETGAAHWIYEDRDEADTLACQQALGFLEDNVRAGKIRAEGMRPRSDGPVEISLSDLRTGILNPWNATLAFQMEGRLYRKIFLSMANLNRELGMSPVKEAPKQNGKRTAKLATGPDFKFDWDGALIEVMAFLLQNPAPTRPGRIVQVMQDWFKDQPSGEPQREPLYQRARRILARMKSIE
jgi:hypothetical protein